MAESKPTPSAPGRKFTSMLLRLKKEINAEDLEELKFLLCFENKIPEKEIDEIKTTGGLLIKLKQKNIFDENNVEEFLRICEGAKIEGAATVLGDYRKMMNVKDPSGPASSASSNVTQLQQSVEGLEMDPSSHASKPPGRLLLQSAVHAPHSPSASAGSDACDKTQPIDRTQSSEAQRRQTTKTTEKYNKAKATFASSLRTEEIGPLLTYFPQITRAKMSQIEHGYQLVDELEVSGYISESNVQPLVIALAEAGLAALAVPFQQKSDIPESFSDDSFAIDEFLKLLREWYKSLVSGLTIAPWLEKLDLHNFFVEIFVTQCKGEAFHSLRDVPLNSYYDILNLPGTRTLILGDAGVGKTTLCLKFIHDWLENIAQFSGIKMVLLLRLRHATEGSITFIEAIHASLPAGHSFSCRVLTKYLQENPEKVLIFIDGFDEMPEKIKGTKLHKGIFAVIKGLSFKFVKVYLSSRLSAISYLKDWRKLFDNVVTIKGFTRDTAEKFIRDKFFKDNQEEGSKLIESLDNNGLFDYGAKHPLLLTVFCGSVRVNVDHKSLTSVPSTFTGFFVNMMGGYEYHLIKKLRDCQVDEIFLDSKINKIPLMMQTIGKIAWRGLMGGPVLFWKCTEFQNLLCNNDILELALNYGILKIDSSQKLPEIKGYISVRDIVHAEADTVTFPHKLYQEFTAAHHLSALNPEEIQIILQDINLQKGITNIEFPFRFASGLNPHVAPYLIKTIQSIKRGSFDTDAHYLDMVSAHCLREYCNGNGKSEGSNTSLLNEAVKSISHLYVASKIEESTTTCLLQYASKEKIPLRLVLVCYDCTPGYVRDVLGEAAPMVTSLYICYNGVSAFSSSPPATGPFPHLTFLYVEECDLADGPADSSALWEDLLHCCLTHAPRLQRIEFVSCRNVPEMIRESNVPLRKLLLSKKHVEVYSPEHGDLDHATGRWRKR